MKVLIVGAGIGGLAAAIALQRAGVAGVDSTRTQRVLWQGGLRPVDAFAIGGQQPPIRRMEQVIAKRRRLQVIALGGIRHAVADDLAGHALEDTNRIREVALVCDVDRQFVPHVREIARVVHHRPGDRRAGVQPRLHPRRRRLHRQQRLLRRVLHRHLI